MYKIFFIVIFLLSFLGNDVSNLIIISLGGINIYPIDLLFFASLALGYRMIRQRASESGLDKGFYVYYIAFLGWIVFSILRGFGTYGASAIGDARQVFPFFFFLGAYYLFSKKNTAEMTKLLNAMIWTSACGAVLLFIIEYHLGHRFGLSFETAETASYGFLEDSRGVRILGTTDTLNICIAAVLIVIRMLIEKTRRFSDLAIILVLVSMALITQNRTAILALSLSFVVYLLASYNWKTLFKTGILFAAAGLVLSLILSQFSDRFEMSFADVVSSTLNPSEDKIGTGAWRILAIDSALEGFYNNPIVGTGFGPHWSLIINDKEINVPPHNQYVSIAVKTGLIGLALFLAVLFMYVRSYFAFRRKFAQRDRIAFDMVFIVLFCAIPYGMGYDYFPLFGVYLGIFQSMIEIKNNEENSGHNTDVQQC